MRASDAALRTAPWRADGERVTGERRYGSMRAGSGGMRVGRGEVRCSIRDGEVASIDIEKRARPDVDDAWRTRGVEH